MRFTKPLWLNHKGDKKDFEVYSCHVSPDGKRLVTAAGGKCYNLPTSDPLMVHGSVYKDLEAHPRGFADLAPQMVTSECGPRKRSSALPIRATPGPSSSPP